MGLPLPSPSQLLALQQLKAVAEAGALGAADKIAAMQGALDKQQEVEDYQKEVFDVVNDEIIRRYEVERRWIDGMDIANPIVEADVTAFAAGDTGGRLWNGGDFAPARIAEFDGTPLVALEPKYELTLFDEQDRILDWLQNGVPGQILLTLNSKIQAFIDANSTTLTITGNLVVINVGDLLFVEGNGFSALIEVTNYTIGDIIDFIYIIPPTGVIPALSDIGQQTWIGFDDTERTNHIATDPVFQPFLDQLLDELHTNFDDRLIALNNQLTQIQANEDDGIDPDAETNVEDSIFAIDGFLGATPPSTIDISDVGIAAIEAEKAIRKPQAQARPGEIDTAIANGDYYDLRYNLVEGRARLNNGSLVLIADLESAIAGATQGGIEATNLAARYEALIP